MVCVATQLLDSWRHVSVLLYLFPVAFLGKTETMQKVGGGRFNARRSPLYVLLADRMAKCL